MQRTRIATQTQTQTQCVEGASGCLLRTQFDPEGDVSEKLDLQGARKPFVSSRDLLDDTIFKTPRFTEARSRPQYSVQCTSSPTFTNSVSRATLLLERSSRPRHEKNLANPLRFRGARPSYGEECLCRELCVEDAGLSGMVALMKMSESALRWWRAVDVGGGATRVEAGDEEPSVEPE